MTSLLCELATFGFWIWATLAVWVPLGIVAATTYRSIRDEYEQAKENEE